jgi:hypothetical protein
MKNSLRGAPPILAERSDIYSVSLPVEKPGRPAIQTEVMLESLVLRAPVSGNLFSETSVPGKTVPTIEARSVKPHHSHRKRRGNW